VPGSEWQGCGCADEKGQIGSGPSEAMCKVLTYRLKGAGMRWERVGADAIMALIAFEQSNAWKILDEATRIAYNAGLWRLVLGRYLRQGSVSNVIRKRRFGYDKDANGNRCGFISDFGRDGGVLLVQSEEYRGIS